jgi:hypothetical protein
MKLQLSLTLLALATAGPAVAAVSYAGMKWDRATVNWYHNGSTMPVGGSVKQIKKGRSAWNTLTSDITLYSKGKTTKKGATDNKNTWFAKNVGSSGGLVAFTSVRHSGGVVSEIDTYLNTHYSWVTDGSSGGYDVRDVAAHEWGHWGVLLDDKWHEWWDNDNTMYGYSNYGDTFRRSLTSEDSSAWCSIYGGC